MSREEAPGSRRRVAVPQERSVSSLTLLTLLLPALTVGALALVQPQPPGETQRPPRAAALTRAAIACPAAPDAGDIRLAVPDPEAAGELELRPEGSAELRAGEVVGLQRRGTVVVYGTDALAPGLSGLRSGDRTALSCGEPRTEAWFAGVGAGAELRSVLHLVNPDGGAAVADVTVWGSDGRVPVDELRGVLVRGQQHARLDLAALVPRRDDLTLQVQVPRGRLSLFLQHRYDELGSQAGDQAWTAGQARPTTATYLPAVVEGGGRRELVLSNPGQEQIEVDLRVITARAELTPRQAPELVVPAESTVTVPLGRVLRSPAAEGALGLRLESPQPVVAVLRSVVDGRLVVVEGAVPVAGESGLVLPEGDATLVLVGTDGPARVQVRPRAADGRALESSQVRVPAGVGRSLVLPPAARWVSIDPGGVGVHAAVRVGGRDGDVLGLGPLTTSRWEPHVAPALY